VYPCIVKSVSPNGKTVVAVKAQWKRVKATENAHLEHADADEVIITHCWLDNESVFKSRQGQRHKEKGKWGSKLYHGFDAYTDPHF
jgi:hypothetical protein